MSWVPWWAWPLISSFAAIGMEVYYRKAGSFPFPWIVVPGLLVNYCIFRMLTAVETPSLLVGIALWNLTSLLARMGASQFILDEHITKGNAVAAALLLAAVIVGKVWR